MPDEDARVARARGLGLNAEGINVDPDAGQGQVQRKADIEEALGFVPSDGASLGADGEELDPEALAEQQKEANKAFTMPPDGLAAEKPTPPHASAEAPAEAPAEAESSSSEPSKDELMARAAELEIEGRSSMNKAELSEAIAEAEANQ